MRMFVCPYCFEEHTEENMRGHFLYFHDMNLKTCPKTFDEYVERFSSIGAAQIVGEDDDDE